MPADTLVIVLIWLFYAFECVAWGKRDVVYFRTLLGRRWRVVRPSRLLENTVSGLALLFPVPPLGVQAPTHPPRMALSPEGLSVYIPESGDTPFAGAGAPAYFLYDEIDDIRARGDEILINGKPFGRASSKISAAGLVELVARIKAGRAKDRAGLIEEHVDGLFDRSSVLAAVEGFKEKTGVVFVCANLLWLCLIVGMPTFIYVYGFSRAVVPVLALVLFLHMVITGVALGIHRALYGLRDYSIITTLLPSPFHSIRVTDLLAKKLLSDYHPFAVAGALLRRERFVSYARESLARMRYPAYDASVSDKAERIDRWYKRRLVQAMEGAVKMQGIDIDSLCHPEIDGLANGASSFCPRCHGVYELASGVCADCPDMALVPLKGRGRK